MNAVHLKWIIVFKLSGSKPFAIQFIPRFNRLQCVRVNGAVKVERNKKLVEKISPTYSSQHVSKSKMMVQKESERDEMIEKKIFLELKSEHLL